ncbi:MAG: GNAT family N-acetyltransferase [Treponema sp.]|nr:GNAT family N-acetyltransferase [Treponema sp.]
MQVETAQHVTLVPAGKEDAEEIWQMQVQAFAALLQKYQDYHTSPAAEKPEKILQRFEQPGTNYYFIVAGSEKVGVIRVVDRQDGSRKRISPLWIMSEFRNRGYAQQAIREAERLHGAQHWRLDTILQEKGNLHLYEKMGYRQTGQIERINERMDIVFYEKD